MFTSSRLYDTKLSSWAKKNLRNWWICMRKITSDQNKLWECKNTDCFFLVHPIWHRNLIFQMSELIRVTYISIIIIILPMSIWLFSVLLIKSTFILNFYIYFPSINENEKIFLFERPKIDTFHFLCIQSKYESIECIEASSYWNIVCYRWCFPSQKWYQNIHTLNWWKETKFNLWKCVVS